MRYIDEHHPGSVVTNRSCRHQSLVSSPITSPRVALPCPEQHTIAERCRPFPQLAAAAQKGEKAHRESEAKVAELEAKLRESKDVERKAVLELNRLETEAKLLTSVAPWNPNPRCIRHVGMQIQQFSTRALEPRAWQKSTLEAMTPPAPSAEDEEARRREEEERARAAEERAKEEAERARREAERVAAARKKAAEEEEARRKEEAERLAAQRAADEEEAARMKAIAEARDAAEKEVRRSLTHAWLHSSRAFEVWPSVMCHSLSQW